MRFASSKRPTSIRLARSCSTASLLPAEFFDLRTRFAGEFVQKLVNYGLRVAAVFPPDAGQSERFREFVGELRGGHAFRTFETRADAEAWLASS